VPLIVRWPGRVAPGAVSAAPVISNDFLPTMVEIAGGRPPAGQAIDGVSIVPLLCGTGTLGREALYWYYPAYHHSTPAGAVREGNWKLIEFYEDDHAELYNLEDDVGEQNNLAAKMPERAAALRDKLRRWRKSVGAPVPAPNPDYDPARASQWGKG